MDTVTRQRAASPSAAAAGTAVSCHSLSGRAAKSPKTTLQLCLHAGLLSEGEVLMHLSCPGSKALCISLSSGMQNITQIILSWKEVERIYKIRFVKQCVLIVSDGTFASPDF